MAEIDASVVSNLPIFAGSPPEQINALMREARPVRYPRGGNAVFRQGEAPHSFWLLLEGRLQVVKVTPAGQQVVVRYVGPREFFGIAVAMGLPAYPATALPVLDCFALTWPSSSWPRLIQRCPALSAATLQTIGSRLDEAHTRVIEMSTQPVERRIAAALLRLARQAGRTVASGVEIGFPISRQDVAEMTGTTLHTVSRTLSAWEAQGIVGGGRQRIEIRAPERLMALAKDTPPGTSSP